MDHLVGVAFLVGAVVAMLAFMGVLMGAMIYVALGERQARRVKTAPGRVETGVTLEQARRA